MNLLHPKRLVKEEAGFTLVEMMVTMVIMIVVLFALYSIFDMSIRVFKFGNDKVEATTNARLGLEKMEREIRAAYPMDRNVPSKRYLFFSANGAVSDPPESMPTTAQITFGNELGTPGDGRVTCVSDSTCEYITYKLLSTATPTSACTTSNDPCTLRRVKASKSSVSGDPVVEFVQAGGLQFSYLENDGVTVATDQKDIATVRIELTINKDNRVQTLTTDVDLRNRETG